MTIDQLSVFVENKAGKLAEITAVLADEGIDIRAMSIADTKDFGILRLIVNDADKAVSALKREQYIVSVTKVIAVAISDTPGSLAAVRVFCPTTLSVSNTCMRLSRAAGRMRTSCSALRRMSVR